MKQWYDRLVELRKDRDLTQSQIAKIINTTQQYYGQYEKGNHLIPINQLKLLCEFYKVSADYILDIRYK